MGHGGRSVPMLENHVREGEGEGGELGWLKEEKAETHTFMNF